MEIEDGSVMKLPLHVLEMLTNLSNVHNADQH